MLRSNLSDYSDGYILTKGNITVRNTAAQGQANNVIIKRVILKYCVRFTNWINRINNTQVDDAHDIDVVMPMYKLIEYSDNYFKTSRILWHYCKDQPAVDNNGAIVYFIVANSITDSFKIKEKLTTQTSDNCTKMLK